MASIKTIEGKTGASYRVYFRDPSGVQKSRNFKDEDEANEFKQEVEVDLRRSQYRDPSAGQETFKKFAEEWRSNRIVSPSTREIERCHLERHVYPEIGNVRLAALTPTKLQTLVKKLEQTPARPARTPGRTKAGLPITLLKPKTIDGIMGTVKQVLNAAVADDLITKNPMANRAVRLPKIEQRKVKPWTPEEVAAVRDGMPERYGIVVTLGSGLGLRQGEIFGLAVEDIDWLGGFVNVRRQLKLDKQSRAYFGLPKGDKTREVPLPTHVQMALAAHIAAYEPVECSIPWADPNGLTMATANLLITTENGLPVRRDQFNKRALKPAVESAGLVPNRDNMTHALRHFYASVLLDANESVHTVAANLGHSTPMITLRTYAHLMPGSAARTRKAMDTVFDRVFKADVASPLPNTASGN